MDFSVILPYLYGAFGGIIWALLGAGYNKIGNPDFSFNFLNFLKTVIIGTLIGGFSIYFGQPVDVFGTSALAASVTAFTDRIFNMFVKKITQ